MTDLGSNRITYDLKGNNENDAENKSANTAILQGFRESGIFRKDVTYDVKGNEKALTYDQKRNNNLTCDEKGNKIIYLRILILSKIWIQ